MHPLLTLSTLLTTTFAPASPGGGAAWQTAPVIARAPVAATAPLLPPPANDDCATPLSLAGTGAFPFDDVSATTGAQPPGCTSPTTDIQRDVWFAWTAPATGDACLSLCGGAGGVDSKIAVFAGSACPTAAPLVCNDDASGHESEAVWSAVQGQSYLFQVGVAPGFPWGTVGAFTVAFLAPNDACANALAISGPGPHAFDALASSRSPEAQLVGACGIFAAPEMIHDAWFRWTAPRTGTAHLSTAGQAAMPTKLAVYGGAACPTAPPIVCSSGACSSAQAALDWSTTAGQTYLIEVGMPATNWDPLTPPGPGSFTVQYPFDDPCAFSDGTSERLVGLAAGGTSGWMRRAGAAGQATWVTALRVVWGSLAHPGVAPPNGTPARVLLWSDPNGDGQPDDAVLEVDLPVVVTSVDTDLPVDYPLLPYPTTPRIGTFFVGALVAHGAQAFPIPLDTCSASSASACWLFGAIGGAAGPAHLASNNVPPERLDAIGLPGALLLPTECPILLPPAGTPFCTGDGLDPYVTTPCPCGNFGAPGHGCGNSAELAGAALTTSGATLLDDVVLHGTGMPATSTALYMKGDLVNVRGAPFGDGVTCLAGTLIRLRTKTNSGGASAFPDSTDTITLSARGGTPLGSGLTASYAVYYRNASASFCPPALANASSGVRIAW